jgi:hypothetical protein
MIEQIELTNNNSGAFNAASHEYLAGVNHENKNDSNGKNNANKMQAISVGSLLRNTGVTKASP